MKRNFFDIVSDVLQGGSWATYQFIIYLDYILRTSIDLMKENSFTLEKNKKLTIIFTQPLRSGRIWHKFNFLSGV